MFALNVRESTECMLCFLIETKKKRFFIRGTTEDFDSVGELLEFYVRRRARLCGAITRGFRWGQQARAALPGTGGWAAGVR